jgi:hypothetical protein
MPSESSQLHSNHPHLLYEMPVLTDFLQVIFATFYRLENIANPPTPYPLSRHQNLSLNFHALKKTIQNVYPLSLPNTKSKMKTKEHKTTSIQQKCSNELKTTCRNLLRGCMLLNLFAVRGCSDGTVGHINI